MAELVLTINRSIPHTCLIAVVAFNAPMNECKDLYSALVIATSASLSGRYIIVVSVFFFFEVLLKYNQIAQTFQMHH